MPDSEMHRTFNMGAGMVLIAGGKQGEKILKDAGKLKEDAYVIGKIVKGSGVTVI